MINTAEVLKLYSARDNASKAEQQLEQTLFNSQMRTKAEAEALGREYRRLKDRRTDLSVRAAVAFMQLSKVDKEFVTAQWEKTKECKRNG